jgi:hypothetical protein
LTLIDPPFPNPIGAQVAPPGASNLYGIAQNIRASQIQQYSLTLEHQFPGNWFGSIATAGNIVHHDTTHLNYNQPLPDPPYDYNPAINSGTVYKYVYAPYLGYGSILQAMSPYNIYWNALEVLARHTGANYFMTIAYTWQHGLSQQRGITDFGGNNTSQDAYHPGDDYGNSNTNVRQMLNISYIWNLPWYAHAQAWKGLMLGGWKYAGIALIQSGFSLDPGLSTAHPGLAIRPDRTTEAISGPKTRLEWFNTAAFAAPSPGYFGNAAPGSILGPGVINFDMALYKDFRIKERHAIEFRAELFNIFNHTNFSSVSTAFGSGNFGQVTGARDPRIAELSLRYQF